MKRIRVLIAEDQHLVRDAFCSLLRSRRGISVVGEAADGDEAVHLTREKEPDIVLMDIAMPLMDGIKATRLIKEEMPDVKVLALSEHHDAPSVQGMFGAGASGFLHKMCRLCDVVEAIDCVLADGSYLCDRIDPSVLVAQARLEKDAGPTPSPRQQQVLELMIEGLSTKGIAEKMDVAPSTVETHRRRMIKKFSVQTSHGLIKYGIERGHTQTNLPGLD